MKQGNLVAAVNLITSIPIKYNDAIFVNDRNGCYKGILIAVGKWKYKVNEGSLDME